MDAPHLIGTFSFRLRFNFAESFRIQGESNELPLLKLTSGEELLLKAGTKDKPLKDEPSPALVGRGFKSEDAARTAALRGRTALLYCMLKNRAGFDLGGGKPRGVATIQGLKMLEEQHGTPFRNDIHGIDVYGYTKDLRFIRVEANAVVGKNPSHFAQLFAEEFPRGRAVSPKQVVAAELYGTSWFESAPRSRFITLVTAIEALLLPQPRPEEIAEFLDGLSHSIAGLTVDEDQRASLKSSIGMLKAQSISQAGRQLAKELLGVAVFDGKEAPAFFAHCYNARSKILHEGTPPSGVDIEQLVTPTEEFVSRLLVAAIEKAAS